MSIRGKCWNSRRSEGLAHELAVASLVKSLGWECARFDDMVLPRVLRDVAMRIEVTADSLVPYRVCSGLRHAPDLVAWRSSPDGLVFLNPKAGRTDTNNWSIESAALDGSLAWERVITPHTFIIVWADMTVATPSDVAKHAGRERSGGFDSDGNRRTSYRLIGRRHFGVHLSEMLGPND